MGTSIAMAWIWGFIMWVICMAVAILASNMILFKPDNSDVGKRRIWFWCMAVVCLLSTFFINFGISKGEEIATNAQKYLKWGSVSAVVFFALFILVGIVLSKVLPRTKIGTWF